jgi:NAD(P)-dependent dehydrogenase (short-subunit alcohol dehydrogenase family)
MRVFVAGASGVIGVRLVPLLVAAGHEVAGMTRSPGKLELLRELGAEPFACDVFDLAALREAVVAFRPEAVVNELTDLPDEPATTNEANARMRRQGTRNLLAAATSAGATHFVAQSIAWRPPGRGGVVDFHEEQVLEIGGVVARYGRIYGPGTFYEQELPSPPRIEVNAAARATLPLLDAPSGVVTIAEPN